MLLNFCIRHRNERVSTTKPIKFVNSLINSYGRFIHQLNNVLFLHFISIFSSKLHVYRGSKTIDYKGLTEHSLFHWKHDVHDLMTNIRFIRSIIRYLVQ